MMGANLNLNQKPNKNECVCYTLHITMTFQQLFSSVLKGYELYVWYGTPSKNQLNLNQLLSTN